MIHKSLSESQKYQIKKYKGHVTLIYRNQELSKYLSGKNHEH